MDIETILLKFKNDELTLSQATALINAIPWAYRGVTTVGAK